MSPPEVFLGKGVLKLCSKFKKSPVNLLFFFFFKNHQWVLLLFVVMSTHVPASEQTKKNPGKKRFIIS